VVIKFPYFPGETFLRSEMHERVGGSFRHGMTSCSAGTEFLLFHDKKKSVKFGYHVWEGLQVDGKFHYTGQGTRGDQLLTKSNLALIRASELGKPIHLIESVDGVCTYLGEFLLDDPNFFIEEAPDELQEGLRKVFVFRLIPKTFLQELSANHSITPKMTGASRPWEPPSFSDLSRDQLRSSASNILRSEFKLQHEFGLFLLSRGHKVLSYDFKFRGANGTLKPDFWIKDLEMIVEAKPSTSREHVRLAIGQVLDYVHLAAKLGLEMKPAILLPGIPARDLVDLLEDLGIELIYKTDASFYFPVN
jgi:hypothetical protein